MFILKHLFLKNRKQPMRKRFAATALDMHYGGDGAEEYLYNLYEYEDGTRECAKFDGGQYYKTPKIADFSTKAQVKAWVYDGTIPKSVLNYKPLIDEISREIKKY
ncbi:MULTISPECIES: hypothetical protein [unclassified Bartonella]|uniref:hypothetical protein n=1 Tax=unclassified Bartonella TaxID=2645622 RepID=UPI0035D10602